MSDTPLFSALEEFADSRPLRFFMPGHKGRRIFPRPAEEIDFTELAPTGSLFENSGPFKRANGLWAEALGVPQAFILSGGSTLGIQAMLRAAFPRGGRLLCDRGCHRSVFYAMALLGIEPEYVRPGPGLAGQFDPESFEAALARCGGALITSPTYYGVLRDVASLAAICRRAGKPLLVDQAHGAHLPFMGCPCAVREGAAAAVTSLHKTLAACTGAALLTSSEWDGETLLGAAELFGSSSPSYIISASADLARARALETDFAPAAAAVERLRLRPDALSGPGLDPLRLTLRGFADGSEAERRGIYCEMADGENIVFIVSPEDRPEDILKIGGLPAGKPGHERSIPETAAVMTPREALLSGVSRIPLAAAAGRVCAGAVYVYPPGIPIAAPGELLTPEIIECALSLGLAGIIPVAGE